MKTIALSSLFFDIEKKAFWVLIALGIFSVAAYVYFITASITNTVLRKNASIEMTLLNSRVGDLESAYLQKKTALDRSYATELGYTAITDTAFVAKPEGPTFTLNR